MKELVLEYPNGRMVLYVERFFPCTLQAGRKIFPLIRQYAKEEDIRALENYLSVLIGNDQKVAKALYAEAEKCDISRSRKRHLIAEARKLEREWKRAERNLVLLGGG